MSDNNTTDLQDNEELEDLAFRDDDDYLLLEEEEDEEADRAAVEEFPFEDEAGGGALSFASHDPETEALWKQVGELAAASKESEAVALAVDEELDDEGRLSNEILFGRHPDLGRRKLQPADKALIKEWLRIRDQLVRPAMKKGAAKKAAPVAKSAAVTPAPAPAAASGAEAPVRLRQVREGFSAYLGDRVEVALHRVKAAGKLDMSDDDIEMLQRMANVETRGLINAVNSWDSVYMSVGFMQWPILFKDPVGKLQRWVQRAPEAFARYGIELDEGRIWKIQSGGGMYKSVAFKGVDDYRELRQRVWAERFARAGLDDDAIAAEGVLALEVVAEACESIRRKVGDYFIPFYKRSVKLRALIQETFNHRPAWLRSSLKLASEQARSKGIGDDDDAFLGLLHGAINQVYGEKDKAQSGTNLIKKTARLVL